MFFRDIDEHTRHNVYTYIFNSTKKIKKFPSFELPNYNFRIIEVLLYLGTYFLGMKCVYIKMCIYITLYKVIHTTYLSFNYKLIQVLIFEIFKYTYRYRPYFQFFRFY